MKFADFAYTHQKKKSTSKPENIDRKEHEKLFMLGSMFAVTLAHRKF